MQITPQLQNLTPHEVPKNLSKIGKQTYLFKASYVTLSHDLSLVQGTGHFIFTEALTQNLVTYELMDLFFKNNAIEFSRPNSDERTNGFQAS